MFIPNTTAKYQEQNGFNKFAEPIFSAVRTVSCAIVHLGTEVKKTSVRTDSSASRGNAEERIIAAKILIASTASPIIIGHKLQIAGRILRAIMVEPRYAVTGAFDHYECDYEVWFNDRP